MLRVGKVSYINTLPLFYRLRGFSVVEGHPAELVKALRASDIDAGIVSSVEFFLNPADYWILPDVSISSRGEVKSVLLLSTKPVNRIKRIRITSRSLTSRYLLLYILKELYGVEAEEVTGNEDAFLTIGDQALSLRESYPHVLDLGEEWHRATGLPFVFALFLVRKDAPAERVSSLHREVVNSVGAFMRDLREGRVSLPPGVDPSYFTRCIDYTLGEEHLRSLRRFFAFMERETSKPAPEVISLFRPG